MILFATAKENALSPSSGGLADANNWTTAGASQQVAGSCCGRREKNEIASHELDSGCTAVVQRNTRDRKQRNKSRNVPSAEKLSVALIDTFFVISNGRMPGGLEEPSLYIRGNRMFSIRD